MSLKVNVLHSLEDAVIQTYFGTYLNCLYRGFIFKRNEWSKNEKKLLYLIY
jgi:hypothetical protein